MLWEEEKLVMMMMKGNSASQNGAISEYLGWEDKRGEEREWSEKMELKIPETERTVFKYYT